MWDLAAIFFTKLESFTANLMFLVYLGCTSRFWDYSFSCSYWLFSQILEREQNV